MKPLTYALQFRGRASRSSPLGMVAELSAPSSALVTNLLVDGLQGRYELAPGGEARLRADVSLDDDRFRTDGTITFATGHELRFRTIETARLAPTGDPHLTHASVITEVIGGTGQFRGARGQIVSNILVSDTGEVTDNHLGVIFVEATP
jgi:hypothetical protein